VTCGMVGSWVFFSVYPGESTGYCGRYVVAAGLQSESIFMQ
jgi:hypothetical protein